MKAQMLPLKKGLIMLWSGSVASIPTGWALCDGNNGTPNLQDSFILGAGNTYNPAATGGSATHTHTSDTAHTHALAAGSIIQAGSDYHMNTGTPGKSDPTGAANTFPTYYALAYIMKL